MFWIIAGAVFIIALFWLYACVRVGAKTDRQIKEYFNKKIEK